MGTLSYHRADTLPLEDLEALTNVKGLTFNKEQPPPPPAAPSLQSGDNGSNNNGGGGSNGNSRPHTPNPILASSNVAWHSCRGAIQ